eukprot:g9298.t1
MLRRRRRRRSKRLMRSSSSPSERTKGLPLSTRGRESLGEKKRQQSPSHHSTGNLPNRRSPTQQKAQAKPTPQQRHGRKLLKRTTHLVTFDSTSR